MKRGEIINLTKVFSIFLVCFIILISSQFVFGVSSNNQNQIVLPQNIFNGYRLLGSSGQEDVLFNVRINGNQICLDAKDKTSITRQECEIDENLKETCEDVTYFTPEKLRLRTSNKDLSLSKILGLGDLTDSFCYTATPFNDFWLKFGEQSIIIEGDTSYNSTDENVTQETGFSHLQTNDDLVLYMPMDSNVSTTTVYDYSINNNDGTIVGNVVWNATGGAYGGAYEFDSIDDYISLSNLGVSGNMARTVSFWINPITLSRVEVPISWASNGVGGQTFLIATSALSAGDIYVAGSARDVYTAGGVVVVNKWQHIVVTYDGTVFNITDASIYVDGVEKSLTLSGTAGVLDTLDTLYAIGDDLTTANRNFNGTIDEVMILNTSLNSTQVLDLYNNQTSRFYSRGEMVFQDINFGENNTLNITLGDCQSYMSSELKARVNAGAETGFSNCEITDYSITGNKTNAELFIIFEAGSASDLFYSSLIIGNITLEPYESEEAPGNANETEGDSAISSGIDGSQASSAIKYSDQKIYARNNNNDQDYGTFDYVAVLKNQTWAFNYVTDGDPTSGFTNMFNITPSLYVLEIEDMNSSFITSSVKDFIDESIV